MHYVALIGAGRIGRIHAANCAALSDLRLAHVVDADEASAADLATRYGARVATVAEVMADPAVAGVIVASSTDTHLDYSLAAACAGKAIFCEKPLDQDLERARQAATVFRETNARLLLGFNRRFDPGFAALHARLASGEVGALETLQIISHDPAPPPIDYVRTSGGLFKDMVIHDFDMARWLLGEEPVEVFSTASVLIDCRIGEVGDWDTAKTILRTRGGRLCTISTSRRSGYGYDQRIEAFGARGMIRAVNLRKTPLETWGEAGISSAPFQNFFLDRYKAAYERELQHFAQVIGGQSPQVGVADGIAALALAEAAMRSVRSGRWESPTGLTTVAS